MKSEMRPHKNMFYILLQTFYSQQGNLNNTTVQYIFHRKSVLAQSTLGTTRFTTNTRVNIRKYAKIDFKLFDLLQTFIRST